MQTTTEDTKMAGPETAPGADAPAENLDEPQGSKSRGSKSRGSKSQGSEPGPGWAHNPKGFVIHLDGKIIHPFCQETMRMNEAGEPIACGKKPRYVRTLWSGGTIFSCGRHLNMMEDFARPSRGDGKPGSRGDETNPPGCPELPVGTGSSGSRRAPRPHRTTPAGN